jgi:hypothetical protein
MPPWPSLPTIRYLPARTVPAVKRPLPTDPGEEVDADVPAIASVGIWDDDGSASPQEGQKRLPPGEEVLHLGHALIPIAYQRPGTFHFFLK